MSESEWRQIETAPRDGTRILLANEKWFAAGSLAYRIEGHTKFLGYDEGLKFPNGWPMIGPNFTKEIPNPDAGKRHEWWQCDNPSAFLEDNEQVRDPDGDYEHWEPTHWMPLPPPPNRASGT